MNRRLSRRRFLGSSAAVIGLPYLASVVERHAEAAASCASIQRFVTIFAPNGIWMPDFTPTTTGKDWAMPYILQPLEPIRSKIAVVTGIDYEDTAEPSNPPGGHGSGTGAFLTMMNALKSNASNPDRISLDQKIAQETAACGRPLPSLQLGLTCRGDGNDSVPNAAFIETISWAAGNKPLPFKDDPQQNFDRIFAGVKVGVQPDDAAADAARRQALRTSVLDHVLGEAESLKLDLSASDRVKLDEYLTSVRDVEKRLELRKRWTTQPKPNAPFDKPANRNAVEDLPLLYELITLALQTDSTRIATLEIGGDFMPQHLGIKKDYHGLSHHGNDPEAIASLITLEQYQIEHFGKFVNRLSKMNDGDRTLLDSTTVLFGSGMGDGNSHRNSDLPIILAGGGYKHGEYRQVPREGINKVPLCNLFVDIAQKMGVETDQFGSSTGRFA